LSQIGQFYRNKFKAGYRDEVCISTVISVIDGIYHYIRGVYGKDNIPRDLAEAYKNTKAKRQDYPAREIAYLEKKAQEKASIESNGDSNPNTFSDKKPEDDLPF
jgi:hypothetical protein